MTGGRTDTGAGAATLGPTREAADAPTRAQAANVTGDPVDAPTPGPAGDPAATQPSRSPTGHQAADSTGDPVDALIPRPAGSLTVTVCRDPREFAALVPEWGRLHRRCPAATPFQSHAWLHSWWLSYGPASRKGAGRLRVVLVRRGERLVGAAAMMLVYRPLPVLVALGGEITDFTDVLIDAEADADGDGDGADADRGGAVTAALTDGLRAAGRGALIDLREVRPGAAAERLYDQWRGPKRRLADSVCLELPGRPMDELIARVGSSRGQRIRANLRKLDAAGVGEREVAAHEVPGAVDTLLRLHLLQWQGRGVTPEHVRPRFAEHLTRASALMVASGEAVVTEFSVGGEVLAANLVLLSPGVAGGYLYGAHPDLRTTKVDVTTLLMRHGVRQAAGGGRATLSLLRGAEPHKFHWRPEHVTNRRLLLADRPLALLLHARYAVITARTRLTGAAARRLPGLRTWRARLNDARARRP